MKIKNLALLFPVVLLAGVFWCCDDGKTGDDIEDANPGPKGRDKVLSSANAITSFSFDGIDPAATGAINQTKRTVTVRVKFGTDLRSLVPTITISAGARVHPASGVPQSFAHDIPFTYTVTAEDGAAAGWTVTVGNALTSVAEVKAYLGAVKGGDSAGAPVQLPVSLNLSDTGGDGWLDLLTAIQDAGKYVSLDILTCTMSGTEFDPDRTISTGKNRVVSLVLPNAAKSIKDSPEVRNPSGSWSYPTTFAGFGALKSVSGSGIKTIGVRAFGGNSPVEALTKVDFPEATEIGEGAFSGCKMTEVYFPAVVSIGDMAFYRCLSLTKIDFPEVVSIGREVFSVTRSYEAALTTVNLPKAVSIGQRAFAYCTTLTTLTLPAAAYIEHGAFSHCTGLSTLNLPALVSFKPVEPPGTQVGNHAFEDTGGTALTITLPRTAPAIKRLTYSSETYSKTVTIKRPSYSTGYDTAWEEAFKCLFSANATINLLFKDL
jgi:hypothetical protein